jgi:multicomponent Na+:H+ antiporter subunit D
MTAGETLILMALVLPLFLAAATSALSRSPDVRETVTVMTGVALATVCAAIVARTSAGAPPMLRVAEPLPGLAISFRLEPLGAAFAAMASALWAANSLFAIGYMRGREEKNQTRFYVCFALAMFGAMGVAMAANLFTLFIFWEVLTFSTYPLVAHKGDEKARRAGRLYLLTLVGASLALLLPAIVTVHVVAGTTEFAPGGVLPEGMNGLGAGLLLVLFVFGAAKAALPPLHFWLPRAMAAPTPVSALLHAVAVVKAGVFLILKVALLTFGLDLLGSLSAAQWLLWLAAAAMVWAGIMALRAEQLKARLAWSTIGQLATVTSAALMATSDAWLAGGLHMVTHAFGKITLFICAGVVQVATGAENVSEMRGLGRRMPLVWIAFLIGALSVIGLPPFGGFWSKFMLVRAAFEAGQPVSAWAMIASSLLAVGYLLPPAMLALMPAQDAPAPRPFSRAGGAPNLAIMPLALTAGGALLLFVFAGAVYAFLAQGVGGPG